MLGVALIGLAGGLALVGLLLLRGRRADARALAGFVPDCLVLFRRLARDARVSRPRKLLFLALVAYLAMPIDLVPDFIPVAGQLDDAVLVALVLRGLLRGAGPGLVREHWPGLPASLALMLRLAGGPSTRGPELPAALQSGEAPGSQSRSGRRASTIDGADSVSCSMRPAPYEMKRAPRGRAPRRREPARGHPAPPPVTLLRTNANRTRCRRLTTSNGRRPPFPSPFWPPPRRSA